MQAVGRPPQLLWVLDSETMAWLEDIILLHISASSKSWILSTSPHKVIDPWALERVI